MFNWFGRKGGRPALLRYPVGLAGGWGSDVPASYEARVREALMRNPVASRAVRLVTEAAGSAPILTGGGAEAVLAEPNPRQDAAAFIETLAAHLVLHGNAFVDAATGAGGRPEELHALRPERVAEDTINASLAGWRAGEMPAAPLIEVREGA